MRGNAVTAEGNRAKFIEHILDFNRGIGQLEQTFHIILLKEWLSFDVTMTQLRVLLLLLRRGAIRMSDLASSMDVSLATATGIVDRLVERDLVERENSPMDRRVVMCRLSDEGERLMARLRQSGQEGVRRILERLTLPQLRIVAQATESIVQVVRQLNIESP